MLLKNKKVIFAIFTAIAVALALATEFNNLSFASDTNKYWKYNYRTSRWSCYTLDEVPVESTTYNLSRALDFEGDMRDDAEIDKKIVFIRDNDRWLGTGFIIGEHEIMTAAHCVTDVSKATGERTAVIIDDNPSTGNETELTSVSIHVPDNYFNYTPGYDYAILVVKEDLSSYGEVYLGLGTSEVVDDMPVHALGFNLINNQKVLKVSDGKINSMDDVSYIFSNEIHGGTSGGPLYVQCEFGADDEVKEYKTVIGIIVAAYAEDDLYYSGYAVKINSEILRFAKNNNFLK